MRISVLRAVQDAAAGTKALLFSPFDFSRWIHWGFSAWLISLTEGGGGLQLPANFLDFGSPSADAQKWFEDAMRGVARFAWEDWAVAIVAGAAVALILLLIFTWLSTQGRFLLIDQVVRRREDVVRPWREYRAEALSQTLWRVALGFVMLALAGGLAVMVLARWVLPLLVERGIFPAALLLGLDKLPLGQFAAGASLLLLAVLAVTVLLTFLDDFVAPLMWKQRLGTGTALAQVMTLVAQRPFSFFVFLVLKVLLAFGLSIAILLAGVLTCCMGLILLVLPFVGAVVLLPMTVFFRLFAVHFLRQFGSDFDVFAGLVDQTADVPGVDTTPFATGQPDPENPYSPVR